MTRLHYVNAQRLKNRLLALGFTQGRHSFFVWAKQRYRRIWAKELDRLGIDGKRVLDAGCGGGEAFTVFASGRAREVIALDVSESALDAAKGEVANLKGASTRFQICEGDIQRMDALEDDSFDFVFSNGVILMLSAPQKAIAEMVRVTKPEGHLMVSGCDMGSMYYRRLKQFPGLDWYIVEHQTAEFEKNGARLLLRKPMLYFATYSKSWRGLMISLLAKHIPMLMNILDFACRGLRMKPSENMLVFVKERRDNPQ